MPPTAVRIAPAVQRAMHHAAMAAWPREMVGLVGGQHLGARHLGAACTVLAFVPLPEAACSEDHFTVPPATFAAAEAALRNAAHGWLGFVHSHPNGAPVPSMRDRAELWHHCLQLVVAVAPGQRPCLGVFWLEPDRVVPLPLTEIVEEAAR